MMPYKDVFEGLGHIGDTTIITDSNIKPVQHSPRRVTVALRDKVKAKLDDLERKGIVEKVFTPTEWISSMVIVTPERREQTPIQVRDYCNYRDEISLHNGILFKNQRVIVPISLRSGLPLKVHSSHQGIASCLRKDKDFVFCPGMNAENKALVERCLVCAEFQAR